MTAAAPILDAPVPLAVDVDGTLLRTDLLMEAGLQFVARFPWQAPRLIGWLLQGKAALKQHLADTVDPGIASAPLREEVVALIREAQAEGRPVYLASASDKRYVETLAERIGGISGVFATEGGANLSGTAKADRLVEAFGEGGYDYVGDADVDFPVWSRARQVLAVSSSGGFTARLMRAFPEAEIVAAPRRKLKPYVRALRPHQWAKNSLVFVALIATHHFDMASILATLLAFTSFCAAASSAYILNDLLDLPGDREHPSKSKRPFASAQVPIPHGVVLSALLMAFAIGLSFALPLRFTATLGLYVFTTLAYSLVLKRRTILDVITLGGLYAVRVYAGLQATGAPTTKWLLMFSLFLFLCLAVVKRCSELVQRRDAGKAAAAGRAYQVQDLAVLFPLAAAAGYGAVLVFTLYLSGPDVAPLYSHAGRMWLVCPLLLYWISRVLILSGRGELHDDPVVFAITDRTSLLTGLAVVGVVGLSI